MKIYIRNNTGYPIDLACGLDQEFLLRPKGEKLIDLQEEDYIHIDLIRG